MITARSLRFLVKIAMLALVAAESDGDNGKNSRLDFTTKSKSNIMPRNLRAQIAVLSADLTDGQAEEAC